MVAISVLRRDVDKICSILGYCVASSCNPSPTFRDNILVPSSRVKKSRKTLEDETDTLSRNVGKGYYSTLLNLLKPSGNFTYHQV
jgi:hypothetical protein